MNRGQPHLRQYYVHKDVVNWVRTALETNHAHIVTIYDQLYHYDFGDLKCVQIYGDSVQVQSACHIMKNVMKIAQYKMPWIDDFTYYARNEENLRTIQEKLPETITEINHMTIMWFGQNDLCTIKFIPPNDASNNDEYKNKVDQVFETMFDSHWKPLYITNVIGLHKATQPPCLLHTKVLTSFHGKLLPLLSINDVFAIEIAVKDHRVAYVDPTIDFDIQQQLRKRLPSVLYGNNKHKPFHLAEHFTSDVLCHFICKYHERISLITAQTTLAEYEAGLLSELYHIDINYSSHVCSHLINDDGETQFSVCITIQNCEHKNEARCITWQNLNENSLNNFMADYNINDNIIVSIINGIGYSPTVLCELFVELYRKFQNHDRNQANLLLTDIDLNFIPPFVLVFIFSIFRHIEFRNTKFDLYELFTILSKCPPQSDVIFKNCRFTATNTEDSPGTTIALQWLRLVDCDFEMVTLFKIFEWFPQYAEILLDECHNLSTNFDITSLISISAMKFNKMKIESRVLVRILKQFSKNTKLIFSDCIISGSNVVEQFSKTYILPSDINFINSRFDGTTLLQMLNKCVPLTNVNLKCCSIASDSEYEYISCKHIQITNLNFIEMSLELNTLLFLLQHFRKHFTTFLVDCELISSENGIRQALIPISTILFLNVKLEMLTLLTMLNKFEAHSNINFQNCEMSSTKSIDFDIGFQPLTVKFNSMKFDVDTLFQMFNLLHDDSSVLLHDCLISCTRSINNRNLVQLAHIQFTKMTFECDDFMTILAKFKFETLATLENCKIKSIDHFYVPNVCVHLNGANFLNMTFGVNALIQLLEPFSGTSKLYFENCRFTNIHTRTIFNHNISLNVNSVQFTNVEFSTRQFVTILAKLPNNSQVHIFNSYFATETRVSMETLPTLNIIFYNTIFESELAFLEIVKQLPMVSPIGFVNCEIDETRNWKTTNISISVEALIFDSISKFSHLIHMFQNIQSRHYEICFVDCELNNQNLIDICTKTSLGRRILVTGNHHIDETFYFGLFLQYYQNKIKNFSDLRGGDELEIPIHIIPRIDRIKKDFDWENMRLVCVPVNDVTIKLEIIKNGELFELYDQLNSLTDELDDDLVDYY